ncbi:MAG: YihY/virulence factor BrkB family protein [Thermodesulfobacteriota bacterium]
MFLDEFQRDKLVLRASALTFASILALVPMLALGTAVLKGLGAGDQARLAANRLIDRLESPGSVVFLEPSPGKPDLVQPRTTLPPWVTGEDRRTLPDHLRLAVERVFSYVERTDFATLGVVGTAGLIIAVFAMLANIEHSMNVIWQAPASRSLGRKMTDALAMVLLLPLSVNLAFALEAMLRNETVRSLLNFYLPVSGVAGMLLGILPMLLVVGAFTLLYRFLPNTRVRPLPALLGGIFGGMGWLIVQRLYLKLQLGVAGYNAIYGSFATVPLFLLWAFFCWIAFLAGTELAFAVQNHHLCRPDTPPPMPIARLALAFAVIDQAHADLRNRRETELMTLAGQLGQPVPVVAAVVEELAGAGVLRRLAGDEPRYVLGMEAEGIKAEEIVDLILGAEVPPLRGSVLALAAVQAGREAVKSRRPAAG